MPSCFFGEITRSKALSSRKRSRIMDLGPGPRRIVQGARPNRSGTKNANQSWLGAFRTQIMREVGALPESFVAHNKGFLDRRKIRKLSCWWRNALNAAQRRRHFIC